MYFLAHTAEECYKGVWPSSFLPYLGATYILNIFLFKTRDHLFIVLCALTQFFLRCLKISALLLKCLRTTRGTYSALWEAWANE